MAVTDKLYLKDHRRIGAQLETTIPRRAFSGPALDLLFAGGADLGKLDQDTRRRVLGFAEDFLDCGCDANPFCGHPEEKFLIYLLELRAEGLSPEAIVDAMSDDYLVYAYPGDVLTFLDDAVRTLEAATDIAAVTGQDERVAAFTRARDTLLG